MVTPTFTLTSQKVKCPPHSEFLKICPRTAPGAHTNGGPRCCLCFVNSNRSETFDMSFSGLEEIFENNSADPLAEKKSDWG